MSTEGPTAPQPARRGGGRGGRGGRSRGGRGGRGNNERKKSGEDQNETKPKQDRPRQKQQRGPKPSTETSSKDFAKKTNEEKPKDDSAKPSKSRRRRGGKNNNKNKEKDNAAAIAEKQKKEAEEALRLEEERRIFEEKKAEEAKAAAILAAAEARRVAAENSVKEATQVLNSVTEHTKQHIEVRARLSPDSLQHFRKTFDTKTKKTLKSDLKKCTAFVKKVKAGGWVSSSSQQASPSSTLLADNDVLSKDVQTLNLSRYVEEIAAAILEAKMKMADAGVVIALCIAMHERYADFMPALLPSLFDSVNAEPTPVTKVQRRIHLRLLVEFLLHGVIAIGSAENKTIIKIVIDAAGVPSSPDRPYAVADATVMTAFAKVAGHELLGVISRSVLHSQRIIEEETRRMRDATVEEMDDTEEGEEQVDMKQAATDVSSDKGTPSSVITEEVAREAIEAVERVQLVLKDLAVPPEMAETFLTHCIGVYKTLCHSMVSTHAKLQKIEKRCEQDRLLSGTLSEAREKGLVDARKLLETIQKSVETLSDALNQDIPELKEEDKEEEMGGEGGVGLELLNKNSTKEDGNEDFGPFDDEELQAFYCDFPDLLSTIPPTLLGLTQEDVDRIKAENLVKYGSEQLDEEENAAPVVEVTEAAANMQEEEEQSQVTEQKEESEENKDTPHYRLMVLLEQELPECNRLELIDALAEKFCVNHGASKKNRQRLSKTLFLVPRTRLDLLPYYSRLAAILDRIFPDVAAPLVTELEAQFHGQARWKKNQILESRLKTARYIGELTKFRVAPPIVVLRCLRRCLDDFTGHNIDVACCLLESCGRFLYRTKHTQSRITTVMDTMMRIRKNKFFDERSVALINSAFYMVKPPQNISQKPAKVLSPLESYLKHLLVDRLEATDSSIAFVSKQLLRFPWSDPSQQCGLLVCKYMLKACRRGRYKAIGAVAAVAGKLKRYIPEALARLVDATLEELQWALEHPNFRDQQRTITYAKLLGEMYRLKLVSTDVVMSQLFLLLNLGHEIPPALLELNASQSPATTDSAKLKEKMPVLKTSVSQTIHEEEEEEEGIAKEGSGPADEPEMEEMEPVAVSEHSRYDPRVPSVNDKPNSSLRIKLVCTLMESCGDLVRPQNLGSLNIFLAAFQRYLFTKTFLPAEVEFTMLDTFDMIDSQWRKASRKSASGTNGTGQSFKRYPNWHEAHNATVKNEKNAALAEERRKKRLERLAGLYTGDVTMDEVDEASLAPTSENMDEEEYIDDAFEGDTESEVDSDEESGATDADDDSSAEDVSEDDSSDGSEESDEGTDDEEDDEDSFEDEEEFDEAAAQEAHMRQLEAEEFERELRRVTVEAIEKGKMASRAATGGKVADSMVSGSHFFRRQQSDVKESGDSPIVALGGKSGISFNLLKRGNKGKVEAKPIVVPSDTNLAKVATRHDDEAAKERDLVKAAVLRYEAESAEQQHTGGNLYLEQTKLQVIRNRPLSMEEIDRNFGNSSTERPQSGDRPRAPAPAGRGGGRSGGRGRGRGGRTLFH